MEDSRQPESGRRAKRKGLHKVIHASRLDKYFSGSCASFFFGILVLKWIGSEITWISWTDAFELALLWIIAGFVLDMYYRTYEERYDR